MGAVRTQALADLRRRRLQAVVIAAVLCLASGAATIALDMLVESQAPFDRAFAPRTARISWSTTTASDVDAS